MGISNVTRLIGVEKMEKQDLLNQITNSDGNVKISSISSTEKGEHLINLAKTLEHEGKIVLLEYCMEQEPVSVSLKTKLIK